MSQVQFTSPISGVLSQFGRLMSEDREKEETKKLERWKSLATAWETVAQDPRVPPHLQAEAMRRALGVRMTDPNKKLPKDLDEEAYGSFILQGGPGGPSLPGGGGSSAPPQVDNRPNMMTPAEQIPGGRTKVQQGQGMTSSGGAAGGMMGLLPPAPAPVPAPAPAPAPAPTTQPRPSSIFRSPLDLAREKAQMESQVDLEQIMAKVEKVGDLAALIQKQDPSMSDAQAVQWAMASLGIRSPMQTTGVGSFSPRMAVVEDANGQVSTMPVVPMRGGGYLDANTGAPLEGMTVITDRPFTARDQGDATVFFDIAGNEVARADKALKGSTTQQTKRVDLETGDETLTSVTTPQIVKPSSASTDPARRQQSQTPAPSVTLPPAPDAQASKPAQDAQTAQPSEATDSTGRGTRTLDAWVEQVANGTAKITNVPAGPMRNAVINTMSDRNLLALSDKDRKTLTDNKQIGEHLTELAWWVLKIQKGDEANNLPGVPPEVRSTGRLGAIKALKSATQALASTIAKSVYSESGHLAEGDVARALKALPTAFDSLLSIEFDLLGGRSLANLTGYGNQAAIRLAQVRRLLDVANESLFSIGRTAYNTKGQRVDSRTGNPLDSFPQEDEDE